MHSAPKLSARMVCLPRKCSCQCCAPTGRSLSRCVAAYAWGLAGTFATAGCGSVPCLIRILSRPGGRLEQTVAEGIVRLLSSGRGSYTHPPLQGTGQARRQVGDVGLMSGTTPCRILYNSQAQALMPLVCMHLATACEPACCRCNAERLMCLCGKACWQGPIQAATRATAAHSPHCSGRQVPLSAQVWHAISGSCGTTQVIAAHSSAIPAATDNTHVVRFCTL